MARKFRMPFSTGQTVPATLIEALVRVIWKIISGIVAVIAVLTLKPLTIYDYLALSLYTYHHDDQIDLPILTLYRYPVLFPT